MTNPKADALAHTLAERTGETVNAAVLNAVRERLARTPPRASAARRRGDLLVIASECAALRDCHFHTPDEILGYDEHGVP